VEVDGEIHDFQVAEDKHRDHVLMEKGLKVIRFRNEVSTDLFEGVDVDGCEGH
jgi:very-short-patch-repair endonuclease